MLAIAEGRGGDAIFILDSHSPIDVVHYYVTAQLERFSVIQPVVTSRIQTATVPWYRTISRDQWRALWAAKVGWMLDAMDFMLYAMAIGQLRAYFGFDDTTAGLLGTATLIMSGFGGIIFGYIADCFGRTRALMGTILLFSAASLGASTSQSVVQLLFWRALLGIGMGGEWASGAVLVSETWPPRIATKPSASCSPDGHSATSSPPSGGAHPQPAGAWRRCVAMALRCGRPAGRLCDLDSPAGARAAGVGCPREATSDSGEPVRRHLRAGAHRPHAAYRPAWIRQRSSPYWGIFFWLPAFLSRPVEQGGAGMGVVGSLGWLIPVQIGAYLGYLTFGFIADRLGRRPTFVLFMVGAAILVPVYGQMARSPLVLMLLGPVLGYFGHGYFSMFGSFVAELFPAAVRATGQGTTYNIGRMAGAAAPYTIGRLATLPGVGIGLALASTSAFFLLAAALLFTLPDRSGQELDQVGQ